MHTLKQTELVQSLRALSNKYQIAFAASCCERLIPNYDAFSLVESWGDPQVLRNTLDNIWGFVEGNGLAQHEINSLILSCESIMPDTEDFYSIFTSLAVNAVASIIHTLRYCVNSDLGEIVAVASLTVESIEDYLASASDPNVGVHSADKKFYQWLEHAPLLLSELDKQRQDVESLNTWSGDNSALVSILQQSSRTKGIQPFVRGFFKRK